jgi:hypothetical protein
MNGQRKLAAVPDIEQELDELYGTAPSDFIGARNDLAARLKKSGQAEAAEEVRSLPKPTLPVWAANQLSRRHEKLVRELIDSGDALQRAQVQAIEGKGSETFREARERERSALQELTAAARPIMAELGKPSEQALQRLLQTLRAAATDETARSQLARGRLAGELSPSGFEVFAGTAPARRPEGGEATRGKERTRELKARLRDVTKRQQDQAAVLRAAEREEEKAETAATEARARAQAERDAAEALAQEREAVERELGGESP